MDRASAARQAKSSRPRTSLPSHGAAAELAEWLRVGIVHPADWNALEAAERDRLSSLPRREDVLDALVANGLLTPYVATRIAAGRTFGLILGNYRVRDRLGSGGMGVVLKAEHLRLRQWAAVKVLPLHVSPNRSARHLQRFTTEILTLAQLRHPNIVRALDAGEVANPDPEGPILHYFVMDYVEGRDLDAWVRADGPLAIGDACAYVAQIADALAEAHRHQLVHRDVKPSNVLVTAEGRAMLLDFGLVRQFRQRMTEPGVALGTLEYIAPEQAYDASSVDVRADVYGLGTTLYWCLTGRPPFAMRGNVTEEFLQRCSQPPPSARRWRPEVPIELDRVLLRLMAADPDDRYPAPQVVARALLPFVHDEARSMLLCAEPERQTAVPPSPVCSSAAPDSAVRLHQHRILLADDDAPLCELCRLALEDEGFPTDVVPGGAPVWQALESRKYDLLVLATHAPSFAGLETCERLRRKPPSANLKIILTTAGGGEDALTRALDAGADDHLARPFTARQLLARVKCALRLKDAQDRSDLLTRHLLALNHQLEQGLTARDCDLVHARNALALALAELVSQRDVEATSSHLARMRQYCAALAETAAGMPAFQAQIDPHFVAMLECCAPLKDIGKVGLPDHVLLKAGRLDPDERVVMESHTIIGGETLRKVARAHGSAVAFLRMAVDVARHHHERFDGTGYPDRLAGDAIPLAARLVAIADAYDALRSRRIHRPALTHSTAVQVITRASPGQYDPGLLQAFVACADAFARIFDDMQN